MDHATTPINSQRRDRSGRTTARELFEIIRLRSDAEHCVRTCDAWSLALDRCRTAAVALVGTDVVTRYEHHLRALRRQFETGQAGLARLVLQAI